MGVIMSFGHFAQTYKILKRKSSADVSLITYSIFTIGVGVWLIYGLSINNIPIIAANATGLIGTLSVVISYFLYKNRKE
ncbi:MAG: SemiSWEET family transporter [Candidatus Nanoarchaeia archaeon]|nr:SemiSWEET family transporter [Candidatus Nanoarchaeia archaeon]